MLKKEYTNCNLCGRDDDILCFEVEEKITGTRGKFRVVKCRNCGLVYVNPRPTKVAISRYYPEEFYYAYRPYEDERKKLLKERIKGLMMEYIGDYPIKNQEKVWIRWIARFSALIWENSVSVVVPYKRGGRVLDIGCGTGKLLDWLKRHDWQVYGVEICKQAAEYGNSFGLNIFNGELIEAKFSSEFFDVVVINQVLEHLYDPRGTLREIHRILKRDGMLLVGVPNIGSYEARVFGRYWSALEIPRHLYHFSIHSLRLLLTENNFDIQKIIGKTFFIPYLHKNSLSFLGEKEKDFRLFLAYVRLYLLKPILFFFFSFKKHRLGELITIYAEKKVRNDK